MYIKKIALALLLFGFVGKAQKEARIVVFSKTVGYRHKSIEAGIAAIKKMGNENNFIVKATEDSDTLVSNLNKYDAVVFLNTTKDVFNAHQQDAFKKYINNKGGFVGVHAATDTEFDWPWFGKFVGAYFLNHPKIQEATMKVVDHDHPATSFLKDTWTKKDEWYSFKNLNPNVNVLMQVDETTYEGGENGENHPISWYQEFEGGKMFYTGLGHTEESYSDPVFLQHLLGGIQYVIE